MGFSLNTGEKTGDDSKMGYRMPLMLCSLNEQVISQYLTWNHGNPRASESKQTDLRMCP